MNGTGIFARQRPRGAGVWPIVLPGAAALGVAAVAASQNRQLEQLAEAGTLLLGIAVALFIGGLGVVVLVARFRVARSLDQRLATVHSFPPRGGMSETGRREEEAA